MYTSVRASKSSRPSCRYFPPKLNEEKDGTYISFLFLFLFFYSWISRNVSRGEEKKNSVCWLLFRITYSLMEKVDILVLCAFITIAMDDIIFNDINCPWHDIKLSDEGSMGGLLFSNYSAWIGHCHSVQENDSICQITTLKDDRSLSNPFVPTYCLPLNCGTNQGPTLSFLTWSIWN